MCDISLERDGSLFRDIDNPPDDQLNFKLHNRGTTSAMFDPNSITAHAVSPFDITVTSPIGSFTVDADDFVWVTVDLDDITGTVESAPATYGVVVKAVSQSCGSARDGILLGVQVAS